PTDGARAAPPCSAARGRRVEVVHPRAALLEVVDPAGLDGGRAVEVVGANRDVRRAGRGAGDRAGRGDGDHRDRGTDGGLHGCLLRRLGVDATTVDGPG